MSTRKLFFVIPAFLLLSCGSKSKIPAGIISPKNMQAVLWDLIRVESLATELGKKDSSKTTLEHSAYLQKNIFAIHHISREEYTKSMAFYKTHPLIMQVLMDSLTIRAQRERPAIAPIVPVQKEIK